VFFILFYFLPTCSRNADYGLADYEKAYFGVKIVTSKFPFRALASLKLAPNRDVNRPMLKLQDRSCQATERLTIIRSLGQDTDYAD
jgi:hypothetical protein